MAKSSSANAKGSKGKESHLESIDLRDVEEWREPPKVTFGEIASLQIAKWVLMIFAGVYVFCFILAFTMLFLLDATFEKSLEILKFMVGSILPLVTLAVGYYLGDRQNMQNLQDP